MRDQVHPGAVWLAALILMTVGAMGQQGVGQRVGIPPHDRPACQLPAPVRRPAGEPPMDGTVSAAPAEHRFDSSERLRQLRQLLVSNNYDAYLVGPNDEHGSEMVSDYDRRLRFLSGFSGSNGYALVLHDRAVLFTDGRYALQAEQQLDCNWWLAVSNEQLADVVQWLRLNAGHGLKVATDARLMSLQSYGYLDEHIRRQDSELALISQDLVDVIWAGEQQAQGQRQIPSQPLMVHQIQFAGNVSWQDKVLMLAEQMSKLRASHYIISQLDEIAWLLNLRGGDIPMSPLFKSYLLISRQEQPQDTLLKLPARVSAPSPASSTSNEQSNAGITPPSLLKPQVLQLQPAQSIKLTLYVDLKKISKQVREHLHLQSENGTIIAGDMSSGSSSTPPPAGAPFGTRVQLELRDYEVFIMDIRDKLQPASGGRQLQGKLLLNAASNVAIHVLAKGYDDRIILMDSLIERMKAVKSDSEVRCMRMAHWRDSLAISMLLAQLDLDIDKRGLHAKWTEQSAAKELELYRSLMDYNRGLSFPTISAYGSNGAIVHYQPSEEPGASQQFIGNQSTYLLDSGGQYDDGTTDITRTAHFGKPSEFQRETYTRVLMGAIDMMSLIFDQTERGAYRLNDLLARRHLFELGLDYAHGTGHGIGLYSQVHEAPWLIENYATSYNAKLQPPARSGAGAGAGTSTNSKEPQMLSDPLPIQPNMFTSVEPGYYKQGEFGIRLENIVVTQRVHLPAGSFVRQNDRLSERVAAPIERQFLRFEPISLVPFEPKLIKLELLSNRQKSWLNSYNLMVRFRMTQQINYYLGKIRQQQQQQLVARLASGRLLSGSTSSNSSEPQPLPASRQLNFMRMEPAKLQEKLELTHKWIMSKTEIVGLDVAQSLVARRELLNSTGLASSASDPNSQRLMLVYMASLPFNDQEAREAAAALANAPESVPVARSGANQTNPSAASNDSLPSGKCSGFQCDLWLLESLNEQQASKGLHQAQFPQTATSNKRLASDQDDPWAELVGSPLASGPQSGSLADLFQLANSALQGHGSLGPASLWALMAMIGFVVIQLGVASWLCTRRRERPVGGQNVAPDPEVVV